MVKKANGGNGGLEKIKSLKVSAAMDRAIEAAAASQKIDPSKLIRQYIQEGLERKSIEDAAASAARATVERLEGLLIKLEQNFNSNSQIETQEALRKFMDKSANHSGNLDDTMSIILKIFETQAASIDQINKRISSMVEALTAH